MMTISDFTATLDLKQCEIHATCACGQPVCLMVIKNEFDPKRARRFIAAAFRNHLMAEGAWKRPQGHALLINTEPLVTIRHNSMGAHNEPEHD